jgi:hypothetical protein
MVVVVVVVVVVEDVMRVLASRTALASRDCSRVDFTAAK